MKKLWLALSLTLLTTSSAIAYWGPSFPTTCHFNGMQGECRVFNNTGFAVRCQIRTTGVYRNGMTYTAYNDALLFPGQFASAFVYSNNFYNPLVNTYGNSFCW